MKLGDQTFAFGPWVAGAAERRGDRVLFPVDTRCMTAVVSAPKDRVQHDVSLGGKSASAPVSGGGVHGKGDRYYLPKGTALTSERGDHVVATLADELEVGKPSGARACGDVVVAYDEPLADAPHPSEASRPDRTLHLCGPAAVVTVKKVAP